MDAAFYITAFTTLFVIIDPIGLAPLFAALTTGMTAKARRAIAVRACLVALAILLLFGLAGEALLGFVGISLPAFRIAGGALLFLTALDMLFERRQERRGEQAESRADPSVFPLALPLIAGPGAIATIILLTGQVAGDMAATAGIFGVMAGVIALTFLLFLAGGLLERALGRTGINIVTRLLGMLLAALSVQFILTGLAESGFVTLPG
ncbi:MAG: MarC family protein [Pseudomonadota bacterium]